MKPKLSSKTPDNDDVSSLIGDHEQLISGFEDPSLTNRYVALVVYEVDSVVKKKKGGDEQATIVLRHIETLSGAAADKGEALLLSTYKARTGNKALPAEESDTPLDLSGLPADSDPAYESPFSDADFDAAAPVTPIR
jgi:hypothetical protein